MLKFSYHNSKIAELAKEQGLKKSEVVAFDLPAGYACPAANLCKAYFNPLSRKVYDAKGSRFRCYAASVEARFPNTSRMRWDNYNGLVGKNTQAMYKIILKSLPKNVKIVRVHSSGDFFNESYFDAWCKVALSRPDVIFFGYTKILPYIKKLQGMNLPNFRLVYSYGGKMDSMRISEPTVYVVEKTSQAKKLHVPVACINSPADDYAYIMKGESFALLIHGTQPRKK